MHEPLVIAIDGPAGAGKSTVAQKLAARLGLMYVDSGATYRAAALKVLEAGVDPHDEPAVAKLIGGTDVQVKIGEGESRVLVDGDDVTARLRTPEVTLAAAQVSRLPEVRAKLIEIQRALAQGRGVVMEGRDIGTVVFPQAHLKIFLKADVEERARRRLKQDQKEGRATALEQTAFEIGRRDQLDAERKISPLVAAADAVEIDSTQLTAEQVVERILGLIGGHHDEYVGLALVEGKLRVTAMLPDGTYRFLDASSQLHDLIYTFSWETRTLEQAIENLEDLLNSKHVREDDFQRFFEENPEFITPDEHIEALSNVYLTREGEPTLKPDFVLKPLDPTRTSDMLELKLPSAQVFVVKSRRERLSQAVMEARAQLMEYARYFDDATNRALIHGKYGIFAYRPRMFVVIGRRGTVSPMIRRKAELTAGDLHLDTYDDIIERMRHRVKAMTTGRRR